MINQAQLIELVAASLGVTSEQAQAAVYEMALTPTAMELKQQAASAVRSILATTTVTL